MQCNPALPWTPSDGGLITLRDPITRNDLLAGALQINVDGGASGTFIATVVDEDGSNAVQIGGDTLWYISQFTGSVSELELISAETGVVGYDITSINRVTPSKTVETTPALPWAATQSASGSVEMSYPLTVQQLLDGALKFGYLQNGEMVYATANYDQAENEIVVNVGNNTWRTSLNTNPQVLITEGFDMDMAVKNTDIALEEIIYA